MFYCRTCHFFFNKNFTCHKQIFQKQLAHRRKKAKKWKKWNNEYCFLFFLDANREFHFSITVVTESKKTKIQFRIPFYVFFWREQRVLVRKNSSIGNLNFWWRFTALLRVSVVGENIITRFLTVTHLLMFLIFFNGDHITKITT